MASLRHEARSAAVGEGDVEVAGRSPRRCAEDHGQALPIDTVNVESPFETRDVGIRVFDLRDDDLAHAVEDDLGLEKRTFFAWLPVHQDTSGDVVARPILATRLVNSMGTTIFVASPAPSAFRVSKY